MRFDPSADSCGIIHPPQGVDYHMIRRKFISAATILAASAASLVAQERHPRRTRWEMITSNDPLSPAPMKPDPSTWDPGTLTAAWIGHATVLLNFYGVKIITDPVLAERI